MKKAFLLSGFLGMVMLGSCEKSIEDKREEIIENKLKNAANRAEIKADSLEKEAEKLKNQAEALEERADRLKDSARNM